MAFPVQGKTALITGAGSGICLELTKLLLSQNCNVLLVDLRLSPEAAALVEKDERAVFKQTDVSSWEQLDSAFKFAVKQFGGLDIVVPGAGVFEPVRLFILFSLLSQIPFLSLLHDEGIPQKYQILRWETLEDF